MDRPPPPYADSDIERAVPEPASRSGRSPFERDRARIVHSAALRRLAAKTQVVGPTSHDFVRNRLTHTLEVAQVGRDLAEVLGCDPDLVEAACLAHDLGHPPFGHNGERALNEAATGIGGFEGNAQTLRLLTRLEPKRIADDGTPHGLNLTRATLDASCKYPWLLGAAPRPVGRHADGLPRAVHKFGVYDDDQKVFDWVRAGSPPGHVCVEAQTMDFADDVAYSVHDLEDGIVAGRIDLTALGDSELRARVGETVRDWYDDGLTTDVLEAAFAGLTADPAWPTVPYDGTRRHLAALKNLTSSLISRFCDGVRDALRVHDDAGVRHGADVSVPEPVRVEIALLKGITATVVMRADDRVAALARQRELLHELVEALLRGAPRALDPAFAEDFTAASSDAARLRVVIDQVASLTDASAVDRHRLLTGRPA